MRKILGITAIGVCAAFLIHASPALAQVGEDISADNIPLLDMERPLLEWICAFVFGAAALAIGFMPSKRSHDE